MTAHRGLSGVYVRAAALGAVAGMRSQLPLAALAVAARRRTFAADAGPPLSYLRSPAALRLLALAASGELVVDKLPFVPSRHELGPMAGRVVVAAVAGAALAHEAGASTPVGGLAAAVVAGLVTDGTYHARASLGRVTGIPDPFLGAAEDCVALTLGWLAVAPWEQERPAQPG
jgi:uncharacterized membrane protein